MHAHVFVTSVSARTTARTRAEQVLRGRGWREPPGRNSQRRRAHHAVCKPGEGLNDQDYCIPCERGYYGVSVRTPAYNAAPCTQCPEGKSTVAYYAATSNASCSVCDIGWGGYTANGTFGCRKCGAGEVAQGGDSAANHAGCQPCPVANGYTSPPGWPTCFGERGPRWGPGGSRGLAAAGWEGAGWPHRRPMFVLCPHERDAPCLDASFARPLAVVQRLCLCGRRVVLLPRPLTRHACLIGSASVHSWVGRPLERIFGMQPLWL